MRKRQYNGVNPPPTRRRIRPGFAKIADIVNIIDYLKIGRYSRRMANASAPLNDVSLPVLLRHAHRTYGSAMRLALAAAGYDDIPKNGLYVIGGLESRGGGHPLSQLIGQLGISKQAAGQLVDALVIRGYLKRDIDSEDRRKLTVGLTARGRAAAKAQAAAIAEVDAELLAGVGAKDVGRLRRMLSALIDIGRTRDA